LQKFQSLILPRASGAERAAQPGLESQPARLCHHWHPVLGGSSIRLGTIMGIRVGVNVSWFFVLFLFIFVLNSSFEDVLGSSSLAFWTAVAAAFGFFGSILLHELGHAVVARREGIEVSGIDLFFFGGVMKMSSDTRTPGQEFRIAIAGPLVTAGIIVVAAVLSSALLGWQGFMDSARL